MAQSNERGFTDNAYFRFSILVITTYFFFSGLYYIQGIISPILFAGILAMLVLPVCNKLEEKKLSRGISIVICLLLIILVVSSIIYLFTSQLIELSDDFPYIKKRALEKYVEINKFIEQETRIPVSKQNSMLKEGVQKFLSGAGDTFKELLMSLSSGFGNFLLVLIYIFFFLLLRDRIKNFILMLFKPEMHAQVNLIINKIKKLSIHYLSGLLIEMIIYGVISSIGFLILGVKQAIFFGFLGGVLNLIPYLGALIGAALPFIVAFIYEDSFIYPLGVIGVVLIVQFIDNNFVTPKIVAGYIRINALASIIVIFIGGAIWGVDGMVLFLPLLGIVKIICDNVPALKPYGYLVGEDDEEASGGFGTRLKDWIQSKLKKNR
ncbi:MAG: AI-2E family transporter [Sporocytophaga sp.]|uniref:AI-2E family transporter n=1 Tax=Sporocytophaga sp. TaxID=2231183 RepID=UPI001B16D2F3|nr:AI-2E family transporter [Sporocytophaga sp.]MBO9702425.1 AI-2E family transporter [Sporocytophaga sp.]